MNRSASGSAVKHGFAASIRAFGLEPIEHIGRVFKYAYTIRFILLAAALSGCEVGLPIIDEFIVIPRGVFALLSVLTCMAAFVARFVVQTRVSAPAPPEQEQDAYQQTAPLGPGDCCDCGDHECRCRRIRDLIQGRTASS